MQKNTGVDESRFTGIKTRRSFHIWIFSVNIAACNEVEATIIVNYSTKLSVVNFFQDTNVRKATKEELKEPKKSPRKSFRVR